MSLLIKLTDYGKYNLSDFMYVTIEEVIKWFTFTLILQTMPTWWRIYYILFWLFLILLILSLRHLYFLIIFLYFSMNLVTKFKVHELNDFSHIAQTIFDDRVHLMELLLGLLRGDKCISLHLNLSFPHLSS